VVKRRDEMAEVVDAVAALRQHARRQEAMALERSRLIAQLNESSNTDFLTGLPNRRCFVDTASQVLARAAAKAAGGPGAAGPGPLQVDQRPPRPRWRRPGPGGRGRGAEGGPRAGDLAARMGGEEFVVLLEGCGEGQALQFAERLREQLSRLRVPWPMAVLQLTASLGWPCSRRPTARSTA
jgi:GGDEF domain-containing protein